MRLDLTDEEAVALLRPSKPGDRRRSLSAVGARQDTARHKGEVPGGSSGATPSRPPTPGASPVFPDLAVPRVVSAVRDLRAG
jgi:hypothetical protein